MTEPRILPEVLVADVMSPDPGDLAVDHDDLPVIAEVQLEAISLALAGIERRHFDAHSAQLVEIAGRELVTPDLVVDEIDAHTFLRPGDKVLPDPASEAVVLHDEELEQDIVRGAIDPFEDARESRLPVDQQVHAIAAQHRHLAQGLDDMQRRVSFHVLEAKRSDRVAQLSLAVRNPVVRGAPQRDIPPEPAASEHPIRRHREVREGVQRHEPRDRALRGTRAHDRVNRREQTQRMREEDQRGHDHLASPSGFSGSLSATACITARRASLEMNVITTRHATIPPRRIPSCRTSAWRSLLAMPTMCLPA